MTTVLLRDSTFSMTFPDVDLKRTSCRPNYAKQLERHLVRAWKIVTRATRKHQRTSMLARDFVFVNARRRSVRQSQLCHF
ncbi:hypothetical protein BDQ17DRAFT_1352714, partial [Cyathus striatus]